jgi:hypothetical protein
MKMRTHFQPARIVLLVVLATFLFTNGCTMVRSESDVLGEYELKVGTGKIELKILWDKSFSERIFWSTGKVEKPFGKMGMGRKWNWFRSAMDSSRVRAGLHSSGGRGRDSEQATEVYRTWIFLGSTGEALGNRDDTHLPRC